MAGVMIINIDCSFAKKVLIALFLLLTFCCGFPGNINWTVPKYFAGSDEAVYFLQARANDSYLERLASDWKLELVTAGARTDQERVILLCYYVSGLWTHSPSNIPAKNDPQSILSDVQNGARYRCVEYSIVLASFCEAIGLCARVVRLSVSPDPGAECHAVAEVFLDDEGRWIMADGQWGIVPCKNKTALSLKGIQDCIIMGDKKLSFFSISQMAKSAYYFWLAPFLNTFSANRSLNVFWEPVNVPSIILTPADFDISQIADAQNIYTHSIASFYNEPGPSI